MVERTSADKGTVALGGIVDTVRTALTTAQTRLLDEATARREARTVDVTTLDEAAEAAGTGWARIPWATLGVAGEAELATRSVTVRCLVLPDGSLPSGDDAPGALAIVARAY